MDEVKFYLCVGGPFDGTSITILHGQPCYRSPEAPPEAHPSALEGEALEAFGYYQLQVHPQLGKAWVIPEPFSSTVMHSAGDQHCHGKALLFEPSYGGNPISHENFQTLDGKPYPPHQPLLCETCGVQIVNLFDCVVILN